MREWNILDGYDPISIIERHGYLAFIHTVLTFTSFQVKCSFDIEKYK